MQANRKISWGRNIQWNGHVKVPSLPRVPCPNASYWIETPNGRHAFTHPLFRFPAKFHPPVVRWALGNYGRQGSVVFDPFAGSGTLSVEALARGISSVGIDIDPVSSFVAGVKTTPIDPTALRSSLRRIQAAMQKLQARRVAAGCLPGADISELQFARQLSGLWYPQIPNIFHWFRRHVVVDIATIFATLEEVRLAAQQRAFFRACAAAIIRRVSNADPAPVSGLEVTTLQAKKNKKRVIRVFDVFDEKCDQAIAGMDQLWQTVQRFKPRPLAIIHEGCVLNLEALLQDEPLADGGFPLVMTSPPYCNAVEYSRRHQLEMYWLDYVSTPEEHIAMAHKYIGRKLVRENDWNKKDKFGIKRLDQTLSRIAEEKPHKARTVHHYFDSMREMLSVLCPVMKRRGTFICVIGDSLCCKMPISTTDFVVELASDHFHLEKRFSYALRNQYMQYGLWNGDGIKEENVLIFKRR